MQCGQCHRDNPADASFCAGCGARLTQSCRGCDRPNSPDASFCNGCGRPLDEIASATPPVPGRSPQDYTPKHLADKILTTKSVIEGERKLVTVLFADLKGSMEVSQGIDPEEWHAIMDRFFGILADGVHRFEGTVNQYTGDGIMALFGAPITHEDHAHRACYAALHLRDGLREYGHELKRERGITFSFRMGINSGEVVVGKIGDDLRMDYTAQGHSVGLAARMEQLASPDTVYITDYTANLVTGFFELRNLGSFNVKGVHDPTVAHELLGVGELRTRLDVSQARGFSKFVGRSEEMDLLEAALARAQAGHGQVVGVVADAGTGKSRLCFEFLERCRARGIHTYQAHGVAHGKAIPFLPILQLFRDFFAVNDKDSDERIREKVAGRLLLLDEKFRVNLPLVFEFLGAPDPDNPAPRMDPDAWRRQFYALVKRVTQERGKKNMAVTLIEDLHWFDAGSDGFLEPLIEATATTRNLLLLNFRPEYHASWMQRSYYQQLPLLPLDAAAIREMLDDLLGDDASLEGLADRVHEKTLGNPFFSEEVVQSLVEAGSLQGTRGGYRLATSIDQLAVPATVQAVLGARIDRLMEREKQVLQTGSVIGKTFPESVLEKMADLPSSDLSDALRQLISAEFIFEEAIYPEAEYAFKHPLTQEVAYNSQLGARRARVHASAARIIEELYVDKLDEQAALLAHHWEEAEEPLTAARWNRRAARWAGEADAAEAVRHWRKVHSLLDAAESSRETDELRVEASSELLQMGWRVGMPAAESDALFADTEPIATRLDDARLHARLITSYGGARGTAGNARIYYDNAMRASELAKRVGDPEFADNVAIFQTYGSHLVGKLAESQALCEQVISRGLVPVTERYFGIDPYVWHRHMRAENCMHMGRFPQALAYAVEALEAARSRDEFECEIWTNSVMGGTRYWAGEDVEGALRNGRRALELSENVGSPVNRAIARFNLACVENFAEQFGAAVDTCESALEIMDDTSAGGIWRSWTLANLSEAHAGAGDFAAARARAEEGIERAKACGTPVWESDNVIALARALLLSGDGEAGEIESLLDGAEALVHATGANARLLPLHEVRAGLASHSRDSAAFERARAQLLALYAEMNAAGREPRLARLVAPEGR